MSSHKLNPKPEESFPPLEVGYLFPAEVAALRRQGGPVLLAAIYFGNVPDKAAGCPHTSINMRQLEAESRVEVWSSRLPTSQHQSGRILFAKNSEIIFGCITQALPSADSDQAAYEQLFEALVQDAYAEVLRLISAEAYPHLIRMWNYFPGINLGAAGLDRYRCFCRARAQAFEDDYGEFDRKLPSASAVGSQPGDLVIYFIAARQPGEHRENPRQVSAYRYPEKYGPRSPSFARATLKHWGDRTFLYISGTASIVGHESRHVGDAQAQLQETLRNLEALLQSVANENRARFSGLHDLTHCKIYIRDPAHVGLVKRELDKRLSPEASRLYLQGDICRSDLLLEIEAIAAAAR